jgi:hypothetical protein
MLLPHEVLPGMLVSVELLDRPRQCWRLKLVQVVHATPRTPNLWLVGSVFAKQLSDEELHRLLGEVPSVGRL